MADSQTNSTFGTRLFRALERVEATNQDFADEVGVSLKTVGRYLDRDDPPKLEKKKTKETIKRICRVLGVRRDWLLKGRGDMLDPTISPSFPVENQNHSMEGGGGESSSISLPDYPRGVGAGDEVSPSAAPRTMHTDKEWLRAEVGRVPNPNTVFWTRVNGESMLPYLLDGTPILVEVCKEVGSPGRYVLMIGEIGGIVKRVERIGQRTLLVASDNPGFPTRKLTKTDVESDSGTGEPYEDEDGNVLFIDIQGRVIYPRDTAQAMQRKALEDISKALGVSEKR